MIWIGNAKNSRDSPSRTVAAKVGGEQPVTDRPADSAVVAAIQCSASTAEELE